MAALSRALEAQQPTRPMLPLRDTAGANTPNYPPGTPDSAVRGDAWRRVRARAFEHRLLCDRCREGRRCEVLVLFVSVAGSIERVRAELAEEDAA